MNPIEYEYREWLTSLAFGLCEGFGDYKELFEYLYSREFICVLDRDRNRGADGLCLRDSFADAYGYSGIRDILSMPCNVLEVIISVADRCEKQFMADAELGDRTGMWLYGMLNSLGIADLTDGYFDIGQARRAIDVLLARSYCRNGRGGLFTVKNRNVDMRKAEIWYQMNWYLDEVNETMDE